MSKSFNVGDYVICDITGDLIEVTNVELLHTKNVFSGIIIKSLHKNSLHVNYVIGFHSDGWWAPAFKKYIGIVKITKLKIL